MIKVQFSIILFKLQRIFEMGSRTLQRIKVILGHESETLVQNISFVKKLNENNQFYSLSEKSFLCPWWQAYGFFWTYIIELLGYFV